MKKLSLILGCFMMLSNAFSQNLSDNIDISTKPNGVVDLPSNETIWINNGFVKYTKIQCPNGEAIHFVAQGDLSEEKIIRAREIMRFNLTSFAGSQYGNDKTTVLNTMGTNDATLMLLNGYDQGNEPNLPAQTLYDEELPVEGDDWYINNNYEYRDAAFEEILHLMHDAGIGIDITPTTFEIPNPALPDYQLEIRAAQQNAIQNNFDIWPIGADAGDVQGWYNEIGQGNSHTQEYLASVIDSYYGLWAAWDEDPNTGMWGIYKAKTRAEVQSEDPMGYAIVEKYFSPFINTDMLVSASFDGIFQMYFDGNELYTHKSQYLQHCFLTGSNNSGLHGNDEYNRLKGNYGNNTFEGGKGHDRIDGYLGENTAIFTGTSTEYIVTNHGNYVTVADQVGSRDGVDTLFNIQHIQYSDQTIDTGLSTTDIDEEETGAIKVYPNPCNQMVTIESIKETTLNIYDTMGRLHKTDRLNIGPNPLDTSFLASGVYILRIGDKSQLLQVQN